MPVTVSCSGKRPQAKKVTCNTDSLFIQDGNDNILGEDGNVENIVG